MTVTIDRGSNPAVFTGEFRIIVDHLTDTRSIALTELDLTKVRFVTMLEDGESYINGSERRNRLKASGHIRLDANIFLTLWKNQHLIPESWKEKVHGNIHRIHFDGTVIRDLDYHCYVLCLYWDGGSWLWYVERLGGDWYDNRSSAVLPAA